MSDRTQTQMYRQNFSLVLYRTSSPFESAAKLTQNVNLSSLLARQGYRCPCDAFGRLVYSFFFFYFSFFILLFVYLWSWREIRISTTNG